MNRTPALVGSPDDVDNRRPDLGPQPDLLDKILLGIALVLIAFFGVVPWTIAYLLGLSDPELTYLWIFSGLSGTGIVLVVAARRRWRTSHKTAAELIREFVD